MTATTPTAAETASSPRAAPPQRRAPRLDSLTGLRFPAALAVFAFHSSLPELPLFADHTVAQWYYRIASEAGGLGVTFFFVLSGFVITWSARSDDPPTSFWRRRFVKILPIYYLTCVVALVVMHWGDVPWGQLGMYLAMLQVWVPDYPLNFAILAPGWSLATEASFYLSFPFLILVVVRLRARALWIALGATFLVIATIPFISELIPAGAQRLTNEPTISGAQYWFDYVFPPPRIPDFVVGVLLARLVKFHRVPRVPLGVGAIALASCYATSLFVPVLFAQRFMLVIPCALIILGAAQRDIAGAPSVFRSRVTVRLGDISFAFYLLHFSVLHALNVHVLHGPSRSIPAVVGYLLAGVAITIGLSWLVYSRFEMPLVRAFGGRTVRGFRSLPTQQLDGAGPR